MDLTPDLLQGICHAYLFASLLFVTLGVPQRVKQKQGREKAPEQNVEKTPRRHEETLD